MSASRSTSAAVRNPLLALPAFELLRALPPEARAALAAVLRELAADARARAEVSWRRHKAPMAAYWKAVAVYAGHAARALVRPQAQAPHGVTAQAEGVIHSTDQNASAGV